MKQFLIRLFVFSSVIIISLFAVTVINRLIIERTDLFKLEDSVHNLILGDSHAKYSFKTSILPSTLNLSNSADSYFYSYQKLKKIIEINPQIRTVYLSFSVHNVNKDIEARWLLNDSHLKERLRLYLPIMDFDEIFFLMKNKPGAIIGGFFDQALFPMLITAKGLKQFGGYEELGNDNLREDIDNRLNSSGQFKFQESTLETKYLYKIIEYAHSNDFEIILVNPPVHKLVQSDQDYLQPYYRKHFSKIKFLDFSKLEMKSSNFSDLVHLNKSGALYFSEWLVKNEVFIP